jgi:hypothetical protein
MHRFRFQADQAFIGTITWWNLRAALSYATAASTFYPIFTSVKLVSLEMWATPSNTFTPVTVTFEWNDQGGAGVVSNESRRATDTSVGIDKVAHISVRPRQGTAASLVHSWADTSYIGTLTLPTAAIIDVVVRGTISDNGGVTAYTLSAGGLTAGTVYFASLDAVQSGVHTTHLLPLGAVSLF